MKSLKQHTLLIGIVALFLVCGLLLSVFRSPGNLPLDSRSSEGDGLRVLYLTLEELGFSVRRKTGPIGRTGPGVVLVFGSEYLAGEDPDAIDAWQAAGGVYYEIEDAWWYSNEVLEVGDAWRLAYELWPYRGQTIWFDEYGRSLTPAAAGAVALTPVNILPVWVTASLWQLGLLALLSLLLYGVRLGSPVRAERRRRRDSLEDVQALAHLMEQSRLLPDALRLCYRRLTESARESWPQLEQSCDLSPHEAGRALALAAEMDRLAEQSQQIV